MEIHGVYEVGLILHKAENTVARQRGILTLLHRIRCMTETLYKNHTKRKTYFLFTFSARIAK
jgi:hypothetical protein